MLINQRLHVLLSLYIFIRDRSQTLEPLAGCLEDERNTGLEIATSLVLEFLLPEVDRRKNKKERKYFGRERGGEGREGELLCIAQRRVFSCVRAFFLSSTLLSAFLRSLIAAFCYPYQNKFVTGALFTPLTLRRNP
jgi:hypothetical protein